MRHKIVSPHNSYIRRGSETFKNTGTTITRHKIVLTTLTSGMEPHFKQLSQVVRRIGMVVFDNTTKAALGSQWKLNSADVVMLPLPVNEWASNYRNTGPCKTVYDIT